MKNSKTLMGTAVTGLLSIAGLAAHAPAQTTYLYQGSGTQTPQSQGNLIEYAPGVTPSSASGATTFDTTNTITLQGGYTNSIALSLNPATGFTVGLDMEINSETHDQDRAGFALIVLGSDKKGVELDFWGNDIWAQQYNSGPNTFTHSATEDVDAENTPTFDGTFTTEGAMNQYNLTILGGNYFLTDNGTSILNGQTHDYTGSGMYPYTQANYVFIGDDTQEASASETFSSLSVTVPEPMSAAGLLMISTAALARRKRR